MADDMNIVDTTIGDLTNLANAPDDALLVVEYLGKAYNSTLGQLKAALGAITSFERTQGDGTPGSTDVYTVTFANGGKLKMPIPIAKNGADAVSPTAEVTETDTGWHIVITDKNGKHPFDITNGKDGKDGVSPTAKVTATDTGWNVVITDKDGQKTFAITNGKNGKDGTSVTAGVTATDTGWRVAITDKDGEKSFDLLNGLNGKDGVSPDVSVQQVSGGYYVTITDKDGPQRFLLKHGEQGDPGPEGNHPYQVTVNESTESNGVNEIAFYMTNGDIHRLQVRNGKNATMPVINVTEIDGGHRLTFTDVYGTEYMDIMDGKDGEAPDVEVTDIPGGHRINITEPIGHIHTINVMDGAAGESPTIEVTEIDKGHRLTIRDINGTKFVDVLDGDNPSAGASSWDDLKNRPFGKIGSLVGTAVGSNGGSTLTWNGDIVNTPGQGEDGGGVVNRICRVSKIAPELDTVGNNGGTLVFKVIDASGTVQTIEEDISRSNIRWESIGDNGNTRLRYTNFDYEELSVLLIYSATSYDFGNSTYVLEPGVYFTYWHFVGSKEYYVAGITVNGYTGFAQTVQTIDPIYLPPDLGDYNKLKNRPFGSDGVQMVEIFPETTVEIAPGEESAEFAATVPLVEGQTYTVKYNGVEYECICSSFTAEILVYGLGNIGAMMGGNDTGEPFIFLSTPVEGVCGVFALDGSATVTLSISGEAEVIDKMEGKFLPEGTPYIEPFNDVILPETVLADASTDHLTNQRKSYNLSLGSIVPGNIYNVVLDGVPYQTVARSLSTGVALGSGMVSGSDNVQPGMPYTEEPFCMVVYSSALEQAYGFNVMIEWAGIVPETMSINGAFKVNKLNKWCLPDLVTPLIVAISPVPNSSPYQTADIPFEEAYAAVHCGRPVFARVDVRPDTYNSGTAIVTNMGTNTGVIWFDGYDVDSKLATWTWRKDSLTKTLKS